VRPWKGIRRDAKTEDSLDQVNVFLHDVSAAIKAIASGKNPNLSRSDVNLRGPAGSSGANPPTSTTPVGAVIRWNGFTVNYERLILDDLPGSLPVTVWLTADQAFSSSTLSNVTGLNFTLIPALYYAFRFLLLVRGSSSSEGAKFTLTTPSVVLFQAQASAIMGNDGAVATWQDTIQSSGDSVTTIDFPATATDYPVLIEGVVMTNGAGDLQLQAARESAGTVTLKQGSMAQLMRR
jgi:hypothetical protein